MEGDSLFASSCFTSFYSVFITKMFKNGNIKNKIPVQNGMDVLAQL